MGIMAHRGGAGPAGCRDMPGTLHAGPAAAGLGPGSAAFVDGVTRGSLYRGLVDEEAVADPAPVAAGGGPEVAAGGGPEVAAGGGPDRAAWDDPRIPWA